MRTLTVVSRTHVCEHIHAHMPTHTHTRTHVRAHSLCVSVTISLTHTYAHIQILTLEYARVGSCKAAEDVKCVPLQLFGGKIFKPVDVKIGT